MRNLLIACLFFGFYSCIVYRYTYSFYDMQVVSNSGNAISWVTICDESRIPIVIFDALPGIKSREFSLKTFSPEKFRQSSGSPFKFEEGKVYAVYANPKGDVAGIPIAIKLLPDGRIIEVPFLQTAPERLNNPLTKDSVVSLQIKN